MGSVSQLVLSNFSQPGNLSLITCYKRILPQVPLKYNPNSSFKKSIPVAKMNHFLQCQHSLPKSKVFLPRGPFGEIIIQLKGILNQ